VGGGLGPWGSPSDLIKYIILLSPLLRGFSSEGGFHLNNIFHGGQGGHELKNNVKNPRALSADGVLHLGTRVQK